MTAEAETAPAESKSVFGSLLENDGMKILVTMLGIYALFIVLGLLLGYQLNGFANTLRRLTFLTVVYGIAVLALNLHWGYTGLFNIGVAGFMAVGAYTMAMATAPPDARVPGLGLPLVVGILLAMALASVAGLVAALPALRLRADYLAIVTVALSEIIRYLYLSSAFQTFTLFGAKLGTGGGSGIGIDSNPSDVIPGLVLDNPTGQAVVDWFGEIGILPSVVTGWVYVFFLIGIVAVTYWLIQRIGFSPFGRVLKAIREDEDVANALGKNTRMFKIKSFMVGCAIMGLAGALWQGSYGFINPNTFRPQVTFFVWIALIIGGAGSNTGTLLGGALFTSLLFEGPRFVANVVSKLFPIGSPPNNVVDAVAALGSAMTVNLGPISFPFFDVTQLVAYTINNIAPLRLVLMGIVLIWLMQNRPEGLLGDRKETAASIDLHRPGSRSAGVAADGGADEGGER